MTIIYEARSMNRVEDFAYKEEARAWVEGRGAGSVTRLPPFIAPPRRHRQSSPGARPGHNSHSGTEPA